MPLTPSQVKNAKADGKRRDLRDSGAGGVPGLFLRVQPRGQKVWYVVYDVNRQRRTYRLGDFPGLSLAKAREEALRLRLDLLDGKDPAQARREAVLEATKRLSTADLVARYLRHLEIRGKKSRHEDVRYLRRTLVEPFGDVPASEIDRKTIAQAVDVYQEAGKRTSANRCRAHLHAMFAWAVREELVDRNPVAAVARPNRERARSRWLTEDEIGRVWRNLDAAPMAEPIRLVVRLLLLTGCRRQEVTLATWREVSLRESAWTIPADRMKAGREHFVPLSSQAVAVLERARALAPASDYVFTSDRTGAPIRPDSVTQALAKAMPKLEVPHFSLHDLRRTVATHMQRMGVPPHVVSALLAHSRRDVTHVSYALHEYQDERRRALQRWADRVEEVGRE